MLRPGEKQGFGSSLIKVPTHRAWATRFTQGFAQSLAGSGAAIGLALGFGASLAGCTFLLDFDEPLETGNADAASADFDAGDVADAGASFDAALAANCNAFEPNDTLLTPAAISPGALDAAICPDADADFYSFSLLGNTNLTITLAFDNESSDLNLRLYNEANAVVAAAVGTDAVEQIVRGPAQTNELPAGTYRVEVFSATADSTLDYNLTLDLAVNNGSEKPSS
tara:strand:+ start:84121 stop:84795 length:675 start_codon:yes stop_codon:yes gene_type:complete